MSELRYRCLRCKGIANFHSIPFPQGGSHLSRRSRLLYRTQKRRCESNNNSRSHPCPVARTPRVQQRKYSLPHWGDICCEAPRHVKISQYYFTLPRGAMEVVPRSDIPPERHTLRTKKSSKSRQCSLIKDRIDHSTPVLSSLPMH